MDSSREGKEPTPTPLRLLTEFGRLAFAPLLFADIGRALEYIGTVPDLVDGQPFSQNRWLMSGSFTRMTGWSLCTSWSLCLRRSEQLMRRDSRLSGVLHVLLHMAERSGPVTSEVLAKAMDTNPVVVRRIMAGLRDQGYIRSEKGHGGGWALACDLKKVTLRDIYTALGCPSVLALGNRNESPGCLVEQAVNTALNEAFQQAEELLLSRLGKVSLAMLSNDFHRRLVRHRGSHDLASVHLS